MQKSIRPIIVALFIPLMLCACAATSTTPAPTPSPTPQPTALSVADDVVKTIFYPEDATEENADFMLSYALPQFDGEALNEAVALYESELLERVKTERLPYADRVPGESVPRTEVTYEVTQSRGYTNIVFTEKTTFSFDPEWHIVPLVLLKNGAQVNLEEASLIFDPLAAAARRVFDLIGQNRDNYYGDIVLEDVMRAIDVNEGFIVTDAGYALFVPRGVLADESYGILRFDIPRDSLYPDFAGDIISQDAFEELLPVISALAHACAPHHESFPDGAPSAFAATSFMTRLLCRLYLPDGEPSFTVNKSEYEALYAKYFTAPFPEDLSSGDGTEATGEAYIVPVTQDGRYGARLDSAIETDETLTLTGMLMQDGVELSPVSIRFDAEYRILAVIL